MSAASRSLLPVGPVAVGGGSTMSVPVTSEVDVRLLDFWVSPAVAPDFSLVDVKVGHNSTFAAAGGVPCASFGVAGDADPSRPRPRFPVERLRPGQVLYLVLQNSSHSHRNFCAHFDCEGWRDQMSLADQELARLVRPNSDEVNSLRELVRRRVREGAVVRGESPPLDGAGGQWVECSACHGSWFLRDGQPTTCPRCREDVLEDALLRREGGSVWSTPVTPDRVPTPGGVFPQTLPMERFGRILLPAPAAAGICYAGCGRPRVAGSALCAACAEPEARGS